MFIRGTGEWMCRLLFPDILAFKLQYEKVQGHPNFPRYNLEYVKKTFIIQLLLPWNSNSVSIRGTANPPAVQEKFENLFKELN